MSKKQKNIIYCDNRKCPHTECIKHHVNIPFNVMVKRTHYKPDKEWNCKDMEV